MRWTILLAASVMLVSGGARASDPEPDCSLVEGWSAKGDVYRYVPDNLFDYMNGNSEGYFIFGFEELTGLACVSEANRIVIDISKMGSDEMAFGIFATNRHPRFEVQKIGAMGQVMPRRATFTKGRYYVELTASGDRDQAAALEAFALKLEALVPGTTELPAALNWFPPEGLEDGSVRLVPQSVLGLAMLKSGYVAKYGYGRAFVVMESTEEEAAKILIGLKERLGETASLEVGDEGLAGSDRYLGKVVVGRLGRFIAGFADFDETENPAQRISSLLSRIQ